MGVYSDRGDEGVVLQCCMSGVIERTGFGVALGVGLGVALGVTRGVYVTPITSNAVIDNYSLTGRGVTLTVGDGVGNGARGVGKGARGVGFTPVCVCRCVVRINQITTFSTIFFYKKQNKNNPFHYRW